MGLENYSVAEQIRGISPYTFSPKSCMYHYLHMARGNYRDYLQGDQVKIKKYFYVLRPILACEWIEQYGTMPPIEFQVLVDRLVPEGSELKTVILNLLSRKIAGEELDYEAKINPINVFLEERISYYERTASGVYASEIDQSKQLDDLFRSALKEVWRVSDELW